MTILPICLPVGGKLLPQQAPDIFSLSNPDEIDPSNVYRRNNISQPDGTVQSRSFIERNKNKSSFSTSAAAVDSDEHQQENENSKKIATSSRSVPQVQHQGGHLPFSNFVAPDKTDPHFSTPISQRSAVSHNASTAHTAPTIWQSASHTRTTPNPYPSSMRDSESTNRTRIFDTTDRRETEPINLPPASSSVPRIESTHTQLVSLASSSNAAPHLVTNSIPMSSA